MDDRVTSVRIMDETDRHPSRAVYMNETGQTVDPATGRTTTKPDPNAHHIPDEDWP